MEPEIRWKDRDDLTVLDRSLPRVDAVAKVTGTARYSHDMRLPGMVYARLVLLPWSRARIQGIDLAPAQALPGVVHAALVEEDKELVRYLGDDAVVAVVAAESPEQARDAARAVRIDWTPEDNPLITREQVSEEDASSLARRGNVWQSGERGDEDSTQRALQGALVMVEAEYSAPVQHHACLETHGCVVDFRGGDEATVYASTQAVSNNPRSFARALGLDSAQVRVVCEYMGGGFGSKFGIGLEGRVACEVAKALGRPVHLMVDRPQEFLMTGNRSGTRQVMRAGADRDGRIVALHVEADKFGGVSGGSLPTPPYIYRVEEAYARIHTVHAALDGNRAMRAPGHPQASFAMESMVDELATELGMDAVEVRIQNLASETHHRQLRAVARAIGWDQHPFRTSAADRPLEGHERPPGCPAAPPGWMEGIGFAVSQWGAGGRRGAQCEVRIEADGSVTSSCGVQDLGTGARSYVAAIVAEELGLERDQVTARIGDSALPPGVASGGSVTTGSVAPAVQHAALLAREAMEERAVAVLGGETGGFSFERGRITRKDDASRSITWREACALLGEEPVSVVGSFQRELHQGGVHGAQAARVAVDPMTGRVKVLDMACVQDQGIPLNRATVRSQINGGMVQGLSYALFEQRVVDPDFGAVLTANFEDYKIAGAKDIPRMQPIIDEGDQRSAVMGMAEATGVPGAGAIANAVHNACGARVRALPITPDRVLEALGRKG